ncbi:hypothetical protein [Sphaerisporangium album]|nr:hypothetical protein [Sphaerisporangium album]
MGGSYVPHPNYGGSQSDLHDIAVVVFSRPIPNITRDCRPLACSTG